MARDPTRRLSRPQDASRNPPDYPENFYADPAANGYNVVFMTHFDQVAGGFQPPHEPHWRRDENGQIYTTYESGIVDIPSDADSDFVENMRPASLPENMSPPPPPIMQTRDLPSAPSSIGFSARPSQVSTPPPKTTSSGSVRNIPITQPPGFRVPQLRAGSPSNVHHLRDLLSDTRSQASPDFQQLPPRRVLSGDIFHSSPVPHSEQLIPIPSESTPHMRTFSPFRTNSAGGTRLGSLLNPSTFHFRPQSTSSPPPSQTIGSSRSPDPVDPHRPSHAPQPRDPWITSIDPPRRPFPAFHTQKSDTVPVNLPDLNDPSRGWTFAEGPQLFPPASGQYGSPSAPAQQRQQQGPPPPIFPGMNPPMFFERYPAGYVPYTAVNEQGGPFKIGDDPQVNPAQQKHSPRRSPRPPIGPVQQNHPQRRPSPIPLPRSDRGSPDSGPLGLLQKCANAVETAITEDWDKLHTYLGAVTDSSLKAYAAPHRETNESLRKLLLKVLTFINEAIGSLEIMEVGTDRWQASWKKQLSSLDRSTSAFTKFSDTICTRTVSYRILDRMFPKLQQYVAKFRDLAKKIYMLQNRLKVRQAHATLAQAHAKAREQLRLSRSRRNLPGWDEDKRHRGRLREEYVALRNHIVLGTSRLSWAQSEP